jgi:galactokinase
VLPHPSAREGMAPGRPAAPCLHTFLPRAHTLSYLGLAASTTILPRCLHLHRRQLQEKQDGRVNKKRANAAVHCQPRRDRHTATNAHRHTHFLTMLIACGVSITCTFGQLLRDAPHDVGDGRVARLYNVSRDATDRHCHQRAQACKVLGAREW